LIATPRQQARDRNIFVDLNPMQTEVADLGIFALASFRVEQARKPREWHADRPPVGQFDPHRVLVEPNACGRNGHSTLFQSDARPTHQL
jgi:hypothetical protein